MIDESLVCYIKECEKEYMQFVGVLCFPEYEITCKDINLDEIEGKGFGSIATALYDIETGTHKLEIWKNIYTCGEEGKHILFHEFTHILDDEKFANMDSSRYIANHGYTEYHASQIELVQILGAEDIYQNITFSIYDKLSLKNDDRTIIEYVEEPRILAIELIKSPDEVLRNNINNVLSLIFNYFGRRSICEMYADNYQDCKQELNLGTFISPDMSRFFDRNMYGWFDDKKVVDINLAYLKMISSIWGKWKNIKLIGVYHRRIDEERIRMMSRT